MRGETGSWGNFQRGVQEPLGQPIFSEGMTGQEWAMKRRVLREFDLLLEAEAWKGVCSFRYAWAAVLEGKMHRREPVTSLKAILDQTVAR